MKESYKIKVELSDLNNIFNQYNHDFLSDDLSKYLYNCCTYTKPLESITIEIKSHINLPDSDKEKIRQTIIKNYNFYLNKEKKIKKHDNLKKIFLSFIGVCLIYLTKILNNLDLYLLQEILLISGWVAIWEVTYSILFVDTKRNFKLDHLKKLAKSKIIFSEEDNRDRNS